MSWPSGILRGDLARITAVVVVIVLATAPWDLRDHPHVYKVSWIPFLSGIVRPVDVLANLALYFPLGYVFPLRGRAGRLAAACSAGLLLSLVMETTQVWSHVRFPSATDLLLNVVGCAAGAMIAIRRDRRRAAAAAPPGSRDAVSA